MHPVLFEPSKATSFRDAPIKREVAAGRVCFEAVVNDGTPRSWRLLTGLKCLFQRQLPKMPREYISRLVYDRGHRALAIVRPSVPGGAVSAGDSAGAVIGGITYRTFEAQGFCEIVFCAVSSTEQVKGFGAQLMCQLKALVHAQTGGGVAHYLTYADNYAVGYFKKQGFSRAVTLERSRWAGYIKDYDGGTLMQCTVLPGVDYRALPALYHAQKAHLVRAISSVCDCARVHPGLTAFAPAADAADGASAAPPPDALVPGLREAGWTPAMARDRAGGSGRGRLYDMLRPLLSELQAHPAAWPFLRPVDRNEVPAYYTIITHPMDLSTMDARLEAGSYPGIPDFVADFALIIANCRVFNEPETSYCKNATNLERFFQDRLRARNARY